MTKLDDKLMKFHDTIESKLIEMILGTVATTAIASDLPRAFSTENYKLAVGEIVLAGFFGVKTYLDGRKIAREYKK